MRIAFVIDVHSTLDVITNSSSELFVISDDTTVEAIEEMLRYMADQWNDMAKKGVFGQWYVKNKRASLSGNNKEIPEEPIKSFDEMFGNIFIYEQHRQETDAEQIRRWDEESRERGHNYSSGWGYEKPENVGKIIIESKSDNSIPGEIMEWIESAFSAKRWHLG
jgi:hypothetical protein